MSGEADDGADGAMDGASGAGAEAALVVDARGMLCPVPVIELARRIREAPLGGLVRILADDPAAASDLPAWCALRGQEFIGRSGPGVFVVRRTR